MAKKLLQDVVKIKKRVRTDSSNVVPVVIKGTGGPILLHSDFNTKFSRQEVEQDSTAPKTNKSGLKYGIWAIALISVVFLFFTVSSLNATARVIVNPKIKDVNLNKSFSATKDSGTASLPFDLVVISGEESKNVVADSQKDVSDKATGTINVYNNFSSASQVLSIDTKLEGSNGKIYKTQTRTIVPGKLKTGTPGKVEVKIYADVAGVEYNSAPIDFKIAGFKGTPKYVLFYARSNGSITGGLKGKYYVISSTQKEKVVLDLTTTLATKLLKKATDQIPSGFILFKDASFLNTSGQAIEEGVDADKTDNLIPVKVSGTLSGILFDEKKLATKIAEVSIDKYDGSEIHIPNIRDLIFSFPTSDGSSLSSDVKNINFNLSGPIKIIWDVDLEKLKEDLLGRNKNDFTQILLQYPNIGSAELFSSPFWKMSLPSNIKNIQVTLNNPK